MNHSRLTPERDAVLRELPSLDFPEVKEVIRELDAVRRERDEARAALAYLNPRYDKAIDDLGRVTLELDEARMAFRDLEHSLRYVTAWSALTKTETGGEMNITAEHIDALRTLIEYADHNAPTVTYYPPTPARKAVTIGRELWWMLTAEAARKSATSDEVHGL